MATKRIQKIPKRAKVRCPFCSESSSVKVPIDSSLQYLECSKCKQTIKAPITKCCVLCAFSNKSCAPSLLMEAKIKHLEVR